MVWERRCRQRAMAVQNLPVAAAVAAAVAEEEVEELGPQQSAPSWPEQRSLRTSAPWVASRSVQNYQDGEVPVDPQRSLDVPSPSILCALSSLFAARRLALSARRSSLSSFSRSFVVIGLESDASSADSNSIDSCPLVATVGEGSLRVPSSSRRSISHICASFLAKSAFARAICSRLFVSADPVKRWNLGSSSRILSTIKS